MGERIVKLTANVPSDEYYKERIKNLEKRLEDLSVAYNNLVDECGESEKRNAYLAERVTKLERALIEATIG